MKQLFFAPPRLRVTPSASEQKRIVSKVTELLSLCDALESQLQSTESASTQLLSAAVSHLLDATHLSRKAIAAG